MTDSPASWRRVRERVGCVRAARAGAAAAARVAALLSLFLPVSNHGHTCPRVYGLTLCPQRHPHRLFRQPLATARGPCRKRRWGLATQRPVRGE